MLIEEPSSHQKMEIVKLTNQVGTNRILNMPPYRRDQRDKEFTV